MSDITPIHGEALAKALENQKPDPNATAESMATVGTGFGVLHPSYGSRVAAEEARRDAAHAKAMKSGWTTSEGVLTALVAIGGLATAFGTLATFMEDLARLFPQYGALAAGGIILGALGTAAKSVGDYAKARSAVKGAGRMLVALLAVGLAAPAMARDRAVLLEEPQPSLLGVELPPLADYLSVGLAAGIDYRAHRGAVPVLEALGLVGVARLGKGGPVLSLGLGGGFLLPTEAAPSFSGTLGAALSLPGVAAEKAVLPSLFLGAGYDGTGKWSAKVLFLLQT